MLMTKFDKPKYVQGCSFAVGFAILTEAQKLVVERLKVIAHERREATQR